MKKLFKVEIKDIDNPNQFAEIAFILDSSEIQSLLKRYRGFLGVQKKSNTRARGGWDLIKPRSYSMQLYRYLKKEDVVYEEGLLNRIDELERESKLSNSFWAGKELMDKRAELIKFREPYETFCRKLKIDVSRILGDKFDWNIILKAITSGNITLSDLSNFKFKLKGTEKVITTERNLYWMYQEKKESYHRIADKTKINYETVRSNISSYSNQVDRYWNSYVIGL